MTFNFDKYTADELRTVVVEAGGQRAFARKHGVPRTTVQMHLNKEGRTAFGHRPAPEAILRPATEAVQRFILTSAQDETELHSQFLTNLESYRNYLQKDGPCEIIIAGFTYNKKLFENHDPKKAPYWHPRIKQYLTHERIRLGDKVDFCGENNSLPTAVTPLTGFETYTRHRWGIFPHAKVQLKSVPTMKNSPAKVIMTTGAVTMPNYVRKRAGIVASFHHAFGAVLVEISSDGTFFCRHLLAEDDGSFYDLGTRVQTMEENESFDDPEGIVAGIYGNEFKEYTFITTGHRVEAINWGDLHVAQIDPATAGGCFGLEPTKQKASDGSRLWIQYGSDSSLLGTPMLDALRPKYQFFHDVADFQSRNHHNLRDPHHMFSLYIQGCDSVEQEMHEVAWFIHKTRRDFCETVIVESNHDLALKRWLKEADYRVDPMNAIFFLKCQLASYDAIKTRRSDFSVFEHVLTSTFPGIDCAGVKFLREDESFMILGIEKGMHGHLGANGARGTPITFTKAGSKSTTGHTHSCEIRDGSYVSGTTSLLDMGYNRGLSSWSHSHVVTYKNGKRVIVTMVDGLWHL